MKLNLIGIGSFASQIVDSLYDEEDCKAITYREAIAGTDLESNEAAFINSSHPVLPLFEVSETYCFVDCREGIAGITLSCLERYAEKDITVFLIIYNCQSDKERINQKIVYNVMQEYARSGVFKSLFIIYYDKLFENIINNISTNDELSLNDVDNKVIDKIIFGVHIYWRLNNETYLDGEKICFGDTIYRIKTFFEVTGEADYTYGDISYIGNKILVKGLKERLQKQELLDLQKFKKIVKERGDRYVLLTSDVDFVLGIAESKIVQ